MSIGNTSIIFLLGILNIILIVFQLLTGLHIIKFKIRLHKTVGIILLISSMVHGLLAIFEYY